MPKGPRRPMMGQFGSFCKNSTQLKLRHVPRGTAPVASEIISILNLTKRRSRILIILLVGGEIRKMENNSHSYIKVLEDLFAPSSLPFLYIVVPDHYPNSFFLQIVKSVQPSWLGLVCIFCIFSISCTYSYFA